MNNIQFFSKFENIIEDERTSIEPGEQVDIVIPMLRTASFKHPWYGKVVFDKQKLETIIQNFDNKVHPTEISFDVGHDPDKHGAVAWLHNEPGSLYLEPDGSEYILYGKAYVNSLGYTLLKDKRYKYFSCELSQNYTPYEIKEVLMPDGTSGEVEAKSVGATLLSGGLTNRPFIYGMPEVELKMSQAGGDDRFMFAMPTSKPPSEASEDNNDSDSSEEPITPDKDEDSDDLESNNNQMFTGDKMLLKDILTSSESADKKISELRKFSLTAADSDKLYADQMIKMLEAQIEQENIAAKLAQEKQLFSTQLEEQKGRLADIQKSLIELKERDHVQSVQLFCQDLRKDKLPEATISFLEKALSTMDMKNRSQKFSMTIEDKATDFDIMSFSKKLLSTLPPTHMVNTEPQSVNDNNIVPVAPNQQDNQGGSETQKYSQKLVKFAKAQGVDVSKLDTAIEDLLNDNGELVV